MPGEAEVQLRERLNRLRSLPLLRGARLSGELERLQRQLDRIVAEPSDEQIWRSVELARHQDRPYTLDYVERMLEHSSATRRDATSRSGRSGTSAWPIQRATGRPCASWSWPIGTDSR
jgi:acetyl-CoA carboxylase alpha subunit